MELSVTRDGTTNRHPLEISKWEYVEEQEHTELQRGEKLHEERVHGGVRRNERLGGERRMTTT